MALKAEGAAADVTASFSLDGYGEMEAPPVWRDSIEWPAPRCIQGELPRKLSVGSRVEPNADGSLAEWMPSPPPALRKASIREVLAMPKCLEQVRRAPMMNADASLGLSAMANQSSIAK